MATNEEEHKAIKDSLSLLTIKVENALKLMNGNGGIGFFGKLTMLWEINKFLIVAVVINLIRGFFK